MNLNKYTEKAQEAVIGSQQLAEQSGHPLIEPEHLLITLAEQHEGIVPEVLRKMPVDPGELARATRELLKKSPSSARRCAAGPRPGSRA